MITLCMDTSHIFLAVCLIKDDTIIAKKQTTCWKRQSEEIFPTLTEMLEEVNLQPQDIDEIVITKGPGSYTGVRIAMTIAKIFCAMKNATLYTLDTLMLYAGKETCRVILDARGNRCYTGVFMDGKSIIKTSIQYNEDLKAVQETVIGDGHLIGKEDNYPDLAENFLALKDEWQKVENVHLLTPEYLKSNDSYLVKK